MSTGFCFDLDGTITCSELLPLIASEVGLEKEMSLLTQLTMDGLIPFEDSFRLRFAILRSIPIARIQDAVSRVELDMEIFDFIQENRNCCFVVTGNLDVWIEPLVKRLGCEFYSSKSYRKSNGDLEIESVLRKNIPGLQLKEKFERLVAVGDGFNDISLFEVADIGISYNAIHASPESLLLMSNYVVFNGESLCRLLNTLL